jgi:hypothetical protein
MRNKAVMRGTNPTIIFAREMPVENIQVVVFED